MLVVKLQNRIKGTAMRDLRTTSLESEANTRGMRLNSLANIRSVAAA